MWADRLGRVMCTYCGSPTLQVTADFYCKPRMFDTDPMCPPGAYEDVVAKDCQGCHDNCLNCTFNAAINDVICTVCKFGYMPDTTGQCVFTGGQAGGNSNNPAQ
jgi:hypothetical protein